MGDRMRNVVLTDGSLTVDVFPWAITIHERNPSPVPPSRLPGKKNFSKM